MVPKSSARKLVLLLLISLSLAVDEQVKGRNFAESLFHEQYAAVRLSDRTFTRDQSESQQRQTTKPFALVTQPGKYL